MSDKDNEAKSNPDETPTGNEPQPASEAGASGDSTSVGTAADGASGSGEASSKGGASENGLSGDGASEDGDAGEKLADLMADSDSATASSAGPRRDLDADAMAAAQAAIAEGERALAAARAQLGEESAQKRSGSGRELALRVLLAVNVLAMITVMVMPSPQVADPATSTEATNRVEPTTPVPATPSGPRLADKYNQALVASEGGDYVGAIALLEDYLAESPRMTPSRRINVYRAIAHYASTVGKLGMAQDYERKAQSLAQSHYLPEDLVATAKAAAESGDQEALRQVWARFLLQQRQIPSSLYQHVAEAYLQLGDSYRLDANAAAEASRLAELRRTDELLQRQRDGKGKER